jgi:hypothetical protein
LAGVNFKAGRVGPGDWLLFGCSVGLLVDLFAVGWFAERTGSQALSVRRQIADQTGWQALSAIGALTALVCVIGVVIWWLQATRRSPALPTVLDTLLAPVTVVVLLLLGFRVIIDTPGHASARAGGYVGLLLSLGLAAGVYVSLRREGVSDADSAPVAEAVSLRTAHPRADT